MSAEQFEAAQGRFLQHVGVTAESRLLHIPAISGRAHVLVTEGPPVVLGNAWYDSRRCWLPFDLAFSDLAAHGGRLCFMDAQVTLPLAWGQGGLHIHDRRYCQVVQ